VASTTETSHGATKASTTLGATCTKNQMIHARNPMAKTPLYSSLFHCIIYNYKYNTFNHFNSYT